MRETAPDSFSSVETIFPPSSELRVVRPQMELSLAGLNSAGIPSAVRDSFDCDASDAWDA